MAAIGMIKSPSQNTGDEISILSIPAKTAAIGIDGQKLLKIRKISSIIEYSSDTIEWNLIAYLPVEEHEYEP